MHVVLVEPEIPQNTGSIARLCAATRAWLHLVEPLGFVLEDRYLRRAGLDYWPGVRLSVHRSLDALEAMLPRERAHLFTKRATTLHTEARYSRGDVLVFGRETRGLDEALLERFSDRLVRIPTSSEVRSINLANAASVGAYEVLRQLEWPGESPAES
ncbi:MAG: tRNA (cytidine(34)-2'-O)-methyltransferase [Myxococcales bacterium]|nr:tRNA (cytidine(34)-2'-O)-methyltransferase [Myxococcales bacterium]MCB9520989.1 tRNA (cytidine(34)-2'-O)-methyltransferase [Myxococcales bacterium]MCB9531684.1 tRNA (cytidine(34)-2'-O)-methyltransferase [Myxococcales bacterium]MCB9534019.1 tRNA (cytidine(34)-2'-O)-methyltransferase [Myxococcales bacterium]